MRNNFYRFMDVIFGNFLRLVSLITFLILLMMIVFLGKESLSLFRDYSLFEFISSTRWRPLSSDVGLGVLPMICSTMYVSLLSLLISLPIGVGTALFTSCILKERHSRFIVPFFNLLAGIPSVVYGFFGLLVLVRFFEDRGFASGEMVICASLVLSIMILPYIISTCHESMSGLVHDYSISSKSLGISNWHMITHMVLPCSNVSILTSCVLALCRALGETMAVMMVIGNTPIMPSLLSRGQTLSGLIALEMGGAEIGSLHYRALFASGALLVFMLLIINGVFSLLKKLIE